MEQEVKNKKGSNALFLTGFLAWILTLIGCLSSTKPIYGNANMVDWIMIHTGWSICLFFFLLSLLKRPVMKRWGLALFWASFTVCLALFAYSIIPGWINIQRTTPANCRSHLLPGANLADCNFSGLTLTDLDLTGANLTAANFQKATLTDINMSNAIVQNAIFSEAVFDKVEMTEVSGKQAVFRDSKLSEVDLSKAQLDQADLTKVKLIRVTLAGASLAGANLTGAYLSAIDLSDTNLTEAVFSSAMIQNSSTFVGADLTSADFQDTVLDQVNMTDTNLTQADFTGAGLYDVNISGALLAQAVLDGVDHSWTLGLTRDAISETNWKPNLDSYTSVCEGTPDPVAKPYTQTQGLHPIAYVSYDGYGGVQTLDIFPEWTPAHIRDMELVACIRYEKKVIETCSYIPKGKATRVQNIIDFQLVEAATGKVIATKNFEGSMPEFCPTWIHYSPVTIQGSDYSEDATRLWLKPYVEIN